MHVILAWSGGSRFESTQANSLWDSYLEKTDHKKGLVEWLKVQALSLNPSTGKKQKTKKSEIKQKWNGTELHSKLV
jgi:hypothetical protein